MVKIIAFHVVDPGSIPGTGNFIKIKNYYNFLFKN